RLAATARVRAGLGVAAADEVVDLARRAVPAHGGVLVRTERVVGRAALVLRDAGRPSRCDEIDRLDHAGDAGLEDLVEVERSRRVVRADRDLALEQDRPRVDAGVRPEDGEAAARLAADELPRERAAAAIARQERGMEAERPEPRRIDHRRRDDLRDEREELEVRRESA